jgi:hypothetical protein
MAGINITLRFVLVEASEANCIKNENVIQCNTMIIQQEEDLMETISFRFDDELRKELEFIKKALNSNQSQAIKDAIHAFYQLLKNQEESKQSPQELLKESGFIGSFKARKDLSVTYKRDINKGLKSKHGIK